MDTSNHVTFRALFDQRAVAGRLARNPKSSHLCFGFGVRGKSPVGGFMIRTFLTLAFLAALTSASAEPLTLASKYTAVGTNPDGSKYTGTATVQILSDTTFAIQWSISGSTYKGFGMRRNDVLSATYTIDGEPGLVIYKVDGNGLDGIWAVRGENGNGTEHLTPSK